MRIIFPFSPLAQREADGPFHEEYARLSTMGLKCSLFDYDALSTGEFRPKPSINEGDIVLYRGWMMNPNLYKEFEESITAKGGQ